MTAGRWLAAALLFGATCLQAADQHFAVDHYELTGNTLLSDRVVAGALTNHLGTNLTFADITAAVKDLQLEYHDRGYDTVSVTVPQQKLTNGTFKLRVFEGRLSSIVVLGNRHFSSNNVMRALPGLETNMILNTKFLQPELDRANANQDRQIFPEIHPGPDPDTTALFLRVKDRFPLHGKIEANNESAQNSPEMRIASSLAYDNLWDLDHSAGLQYTFSEQDYKIGNQWKYYDYPLVANYSGFYRLPLAAPESMADQVSSTISHFGYNEATHRFDLPPASGAPELNIYASGSTIDTGVLYGNPKRVSTQVDTNGNLVGTIDQRTDHQDLTVNDAIGFKITKPFRQFAGIDSHVQAGLDFKTYNTVNYETNVFIFTAFGETTTGSKFTRTSFVPSPVPTAYSVIEYLPLTIRWDGDRYDQWGRTDFGIGYSPNLWYSGEREDVQEIVGSTRASGFWHIFNANLGREFLLPQGWKVELKADGQWSSEPLINLEQFGVGGMAGVRGYREGDTYGDTGWRFTSDLKTPPHEIGFVTETSRWPLVVSSSIFADYGEVFLLDPQGRKTSTRLCGVGVEGQAAIGPHFQGMLMCGVPLIDTPTTEAFQLRVIFSLTAQF